MDLLAAQKQLSSVLNGLKKSIPPQDQVIVNQVQQAMKKNDVEKLKELQTKLTEKYATSNK